ncbi:MAG: NTP transferase domain-containing protein [Parcubacteria group bacterium]|nr:NTP transferase domain-containing protein [Parcubacteria group bacterium]
MSDTEAIILAGGKGTRMNLDCPKVLCNACDKPIISHLLKSIREVCKNPTIVIGYKGEDVMRELGDKYNYVWQREQFGTGHAVMCVKGELSSKEEIKNIVVFLGDHPLVSSETAKKLVEFHKENGAVVTVGTVVAPSLEDEFERFYHYGRIIRKEDGSIERIVELKDANNEQKKICEVNVSYYCFDAKWLWENISKLENNNAAGEYYLTDMVGIAVEQRKKVVSFVIKNPVEAFGVNTAEELRAVEQYLNDRK